MKSIVLPEKAVTITPDDLEGNEVIVYKCRSNSREGSYAILSRLSNNGKLQYGFVNLFFPTYKPVYVDTSFYSVVKKAAKQRDLKVFDNAKEMMQAILDGDFKSSIEKLKLKIHPVNLLKLSEEDRNSEYYLEKLYAWKEDFNWVEWDEFYESWHYCSTCKGYSEGQCICYAR